MGAIVTNQIIILTLLMVTGIVLRKIRILSDELVSGLTRLLLNLTMPCMILYSFSLPFSPAMLAGAVTVLIASTATHLGLIIIGIVIYRRFKPATRHVLQFSTVFSNCGFVGYPVAQGVFGTLGVFYTSIFTIPFNILMWSYGVLLFTGERNPRVMMRNLVNAPTVAIVIGFIFFVFSAPIPKPVLQSFSMVGGMTTPISMFIIGALLADVRLREVLTGWDVYYMSMWKLILAPLMCFGALRLASVDQTITYLCVLLVAMPTASMVGILAERYNADKAAASRSAFITTVLSLVTVPLLLAWL